MKVGVFSDVHDQLVNLDKVLAYFESQGIDRLIFCGDFCSPIPARRMGGFKGTVDCVFGNGDGDRFTIQKFATKEFPNLVLHGEHAEIDLDKRRVAVTHYPLYGRALAHTADYDAVFSGHTHEKSSEVIGKCLWVNPGEVMGAFGDATFGIYDTATNTVEFKTL